MAVLEQTGRQIAQKPVRRHLATAVFAAVIAVLILGWLARTVSLQDVATFSLTLDEGGAIRIPDLVLPVGVTLYVCAVLAAAIAVLTAVTGSVSVNGSRGKLAAIFTRTRGGVWISLITLLFLCAFLTWAAAGKSLSLIGMLQGSLLGAIPILLAALSGVMCERSGVVNIATEGMMLSAAFTSVVVASVTHSLLLGAVAGVLTGALLALLHAYLSIAYSVDHVVSGTVINIFSIGITSYLSQRFLQQSYWLNNSGTVPTWAVPGLAKIPIIGPVLFSGNPFFFAAIALVVLVHLALFRTKFGLRVRAVGEHPRAADTLGINVNRMRYLSVTIGGAIAGLGGAYFTIGSVGRFDEMLTAGKGFIGLAAMIFGKWTPVGSMWASMLFGFADALQTKLQILFIPIPSEFLLMAPYVVTMAVLAGVVGRAVAPAADGKPYEK